jgi:hypothetical protein
MGKDRKRNGIPQRGVPPPPPPKSPVSSRPSFPSPPPQRTPSYCCWAAYFSAMLKISGPLQACEQWKHLTGLWTVKIEPANSQVPWKLRAIKEKQSFSTVVLICQELTICMFVHLICMLFDFIEKVFLSISGEKKNWETNTLYSSEPVTLLGRKFFFFDKQKI